MNPNESGAVESFRDFADGLAEEVRVPSGKVQSNVVCLGLDPIDVVYRNKDHATARLDNQPTVRFMTVFQRIAGHYLAHPHLVAYAHFNVPLPVL